jgi:hypothetical protein
MIVGLVGTVKENLEKVYARIFLSLYQQWNIAIVKIIYLLIKLIEFQMPNHS